MVKYNFYRTKSLCQKWKKFSKYTYISVIILIVITVKMQHGDLHETYSTNVEEIINSRLKGPLPYDDRTLIELIKEKYIINPPQDWQITPMRNFSEFKTWIFLYGAINLLFGQKRSGFFIEAGALDGQYMSNSLYLESHLNWTGLLVEPDIEAFQSLISKRRNVWASNSCLSPNGYPEQSVMGSISRKKLKKLETEEKILNFKAETQLLADLNNNLFSTFHYVQCLPIASLIMAVGKTKIDLFILDVEGVEIPILDTFPWNKIIVDVWMIEHKFAIKVMEDGEYTAKYVRDDDFIRKFEERGYTLMGHLDPPHDFIFVRNDSSVYSIASRLTVKDLAPFIEN